MVFIMNIVIIDENQTITCTLGAAPTIPLDYGVYYANSNNSSFGEDNSLGKIFSGGETTILNSPAASTRRVIKEITIHNPNTGSVEITIKIKDGANSYIVHRGSIGSGKTWRLSGNNDATSVSGENNTASNVGSGGVGVFKQKSGVDLQFKKINAGSNRVSITDDTVNSEVDIDVNESNLTLPASQVTDFDTEVSNNTDVAANTTHRSSSANPHGVTKDQVGLGNVTNDAQIPLSQKGAASGVAELDASGTVLSSQLPSFVDDVLEYSGFGSLPATGETGKIYITLNDNKTYRWSGSSYVEISASLALGETVDTAYRGDRGKTAYDHSLVSGNPHNTAASNIGTDTTNFNGNLSSADNTIQKALNTLDDMTSGGGNVDIDGTAGETITALDRVYLNSSNNKWYRVDSDSTNPAVGSMRGVAIDAITSDSSGTIRTRGVVSGYTGLTAGAEVWASVNPGGHTQTKPSVSAGGGQVVVDHIGIAISTSKILLSNRAIRFLKRESLEDGETMIIVHGSDARGRGRLVDSYTTTFVNKILTEHGVSNQDSKYQLRAGGYTVDRCTGGTALASAEYGAGFEASKAFDDNDTTKWLNAGGPTGTLRYDFGAGVSRTITRYTITACSDHPGNEKQTPSAWTFQGSNNGGSWTTLDTRNGETGWTPGQKRTYDLTNSTAYRYYRLNITNNDASAYTSVAEMEMLETIKTYDRIAQSFQISSSDTLNDVAIYLRRVGSPNGTLTIRIETDNAGSPSGTLADSNATATLSEAGLGASYGMVTVNFTDFAISGSTKYWIVVSTSRTAGPTNYVEWGVDASSSGYAYGGVSLYAGGTWSGQTTDAIFRVDGVGTTYDNPLIIDRWGGTVGDVECRFDNGSGDNANTNTTFKNSSGAEMDMTCGVILP